MRSHLQFWLGIFAVLVTIIIICYALRPVYLLHVSIQPQPSSGFRILSDRMDLFQEGDGPIFIDVNGFVEDSAISKVMCSIRPVHESVWYTQGAGWPVSKGVFLGTAQLGSIEYPINQDEQYNFRMDSPTGTLLSEGEIRVNIRATSWGSQWLILSLGLLSAILQIISFISAMNTKVQAQTLPENSQPQSNKDKEGAFGTDTSETEA